MRLFRCDLCGAETQSLNMAHHVMPIPEKSNLEDICDKCSIEWRDKNEKQLHGIVEKMWQEEAEVFIAGKRANNPYYKPNGNNVQPTEANELPKVDS